SCRLSGSGMVQSGRGQRARIPGLCRLDQHATAHFHVQSMAEPAAVVPVHPGLVGSEGDGGCLLRTDLHAHTVVDHNEAVSHVLDLVDVGADHGDLIALLDGELVEPEGRRHGDHVYPDLVAVADDLAVGGQVDATCLGHLHGFGKEGVVPIPDLLGTDLVAAGHDAVVWFGEGGAVVHQDHLVAGDVDQLVVLRVQR